MPKFSLAAPKKLSCPKFGGAAAPLAPPGPYAYGREDPPDKIIDKFGAYDRGTMSVHYSSLLTDRCNVPENAYIKLISARKTEALHLYT